MSAYHTVDELIDYLKTQPQKAVVLCSSDSEGNNLSPFESAAPAAPIEDQFIDELPEYLTNLRGMSSIILYPSR